MTMVMTMTPYGPCARRDGVSPARGADVLGGILAKNP